MNHTAGMLPRVLLLLALMMPALPAAEIEVDPMAKALVDSFARKRAEGLIKLNEAFIPRFKEISIMYLKEEDLDKAKAARDKATSLEAEVDLLKALLESLPAEANEE